MVSSAYLRLLIFLPAILIPVCASSSPAFLMMYSAYKLNKQGDNIQPWCTPFSIWNQSVVPCTTCCFLTCIQISQEADQVVWYSHLCKNFPQFVVIHTVPCGLAGKESVRNAGDLGSIPGLGRSPGEGKGYPLQYPGLENSMDCIIHGVAKSRTRLSDFHFHTKALA